MDRLLQSWIQRYSHFETAAGDLAMGEREASALHQPAQS
jgi:hypothetical protein